jgi:hypothetical protein
VARRTRELGGRLPRPAADPLARPHRRGPGIERDRQPPRLAADVPRRSRRARRRREAQGGHTVGDRTFKVHIDGHDLLAYLTGEVDKGPRPGFVYFSDDGDLLAIRLDNWKLVFMEQRATGTLQVWAEPFVPLRVPKMFNLRTDPFERADVTSNTYWDWILDNAFMVYAAQTLIAEFLATFAEFPPRQKAGSFTIDRALEKLEATITAGR